MNNMLLFWIVIGVVAGWMAKLVVPGQGPGGIVGDFLVGILGAVVGGYLFHGFAGPTYQGWVESLGVSFLGAVVCLVVLRLIGGRSVTARI